MAVALLAGELLRGAEEWVRGIQAARVEDHVSGLVHERSTAVDLSFYESPDFHDHLHRARHEARHRPVALLENVGTLVQQGITLVAMAGVLLAFGWWLSVALVASTLPALAVVLRHAVVQHGWRRRVTPEERRATYHDWLMTATETAAEVRLFALGPGLRRAYQAIRSRLRREEQGLAQRQVLAELLAGAFALGVAGACVAWVLWRVVLGEATLGDAALFYMAFSHGQRLLRSLLAGAGQVYYNLLFLGNLFEFLDLVPRVVDPANPVSMPVPGTRGLPIAFRAVTFGYPGGERVALAGLDLACAAGEIAAIVGANGAGKSTLLKLLCRFYDADRGRVEVAGVDVRDLGLEALRESITVLFQEPVRYDATVAENIAMGAPGASVARIEAAARAAGCHELVERLPRGYETLLGRWFEGGVELSVGEWQRIALARAFLRPAPVLLLDEPTSAMDSWAEADWLRRFRTLAAGRTALVITHRFTTAMQADVIHVMQAGRVVESGSHATLVQGGGLYARSWNEQMRTAAELAQ
jgi:ATP-binding cassette subfamily B protein